MTAIPMGLRYGVRIKTSAERRAETNAYMDQNLYDAYPAPICCAFVFLCIGLGWLGVFFPPVSFLLALLMKSGDCDVRAAACRALSRVSWPSRWSVRVLEFCIYDPSGEVERAVSDSISTLGPKYVSLNAYLALLVSNRAESEEIGRLLAQDGRKKGSSDVADQIDVLLQVGDQLSSDDPFLETFLEELAPWAQFDVWNAIEKLTEGILPNAERDFPDPYRAKRRRLFAIRSLRSALVRFKGHPDFAEKFDALKNQLAIACLSESDEAISGELSLLLEALA